MYFVKHNLRAACFSAVWDSQWLCAHLVLCASSFFKSIHLVSVETQRIFIRYVWHVKTLRPPHVLCAAGGESVLVQIAKTRSSGCVSLCAVSVSPKPASGTYRMSLTQRHPLAPGTQHDKACVWIFRGSWRDSMLGRWWLEMGATSCSWSGVGMWRRDTGLLKQRLNTPKQVERCFVTFSFKGGRFYTHDKKKPRPCVHQGFSLVLHYTWITDISKVTRQPFVMSDPAVGLLLAFQENMRWL